MTYRPCLTTFAPIFTNFSRSVVRDQCSTSFGKANVRMKLARLVERRFNLLIDTLRAGVVLARGSMRLEKLKPLVGDMLVAQAGNGLWRFPRQTDSFRLIGHEPT